MKNVKRKKTAAAVIVLLLLAAAYAVYSRPMTLFQLHPLLPLDQCVGISGYYHTSEQTSGFTQFTIEADSEEFQELCSLFNEKTYRRSLKDLLPRGTRTHLTTSKFDFQWKVWFHFDTVELPDGNGGSGSLLQVNYWYGELEIDNALLENGRRICRTKDQDAWAKEILEIIQ